MVYHIYIWYFNHSECNERKDGFLGILIITLILTSTYPGVFLGLEWVWASNTVISTVDVGERPSALAFNPSNNNIYVANAYSNNVSVIESSSNTVISTVDVGDGPSALAFNPSNNNIYVTNPVSDDVSVIETTGSKPIVDAISDQSISIRNLVLSYGNNM